MNNREKELVEMINQISMEIDKLNKESNNYGNILAISDYMLKKQKNVVLIMLLLGCLVGGIFSYGSILIGILTGGLCGVGFSIFPVLLSSMFYRSINKMCNKKINDNNVDVLLYMELKKKYKEELLQLKQNSADNINDNSNINEENNNIVIKPKLVNTMNVESKIKKREIIK